jgi:hypothetical protein
MTNTYKGFSVGDKVTVKCSCKKEGMMGRAMSWDKWVEKYKPVKNHMTDAPVDGFMFETYGKEVAHVKRVARKTPNKVWTMVDGDNCKCYAIPGWHFVNRIGYFICEVPFPTEQDTKDVLI